jgi:serine/threonine protein kinase
LLAGIAIVFHKKKYRKGGSMHFEGSDPATDNGNRSNVVLSMTSLLRPASLPPDLNAASKDSKENENVTGRGLIVIELKEVHFDEDNSLGQGSFGHVHKGTWNRTSVAVKFLLDHHATWSSPDADLGKTLREEALLMAQLRHPNIVQFMGICRDPAAIVTEFCARRSLHAILAQARGSPAKAAELTWDRRLGLLADAARGMLYLHSNKPHAIVHGDVKSLNVVVTEQWVAKVCDFGFSRAITQHHSRDISSSHLPGNPRWLAPELLKEEGQPSTKSDVYAFAMVMWEVLVWQVPWESAQNIAVLRLVRRGERPLIPPTNELPGPPGSEAVLPRYLRLMEHCWRESPEERPSFDVIVDEVQAYANVA